MNLNKIALVTATSILAFATTANAVLGPIPIYLNTEYRTASPVIGSIASTIKMTKGEIQQTGVNTFTELLATVPSVTFEGGQGNLGALRIRGNEASHTLLLVDGSVVSITATQPNFDVVPLDQIERIEISKGPFSSLYGPGAIGGVIHVFTNKESTKEKQSTIKLSYGTHNSKKVSLASHFKSGENYLNLSMSDYHTDGIDATGNGDLDPVDRTSSGVNFGTVITDKTHVKLNVLKTEADIEYDDSWSTPKPDNNLTQFNLETTHQFSEKLNTRLDVMRQKTQRRGDKYKLNTLTLINELSLENAKLSIGFSDVIDKDVDNSKQIKHTDLFTQWQGNVGDNELSFGVRLVDHDKFSTHTTYNLNWAKNYSANTRVNAAFGKATNLPSHYQNNLNITRNKTNLKPEHSITFEIGANKQYDWGNIDTKIYKSKLSNAFKYSGTWSVDDHYINEGTVDIKGAELAVNTHLAGWDVNSSYDYNTAVAKSTGLQKGRRPNHFINLTLTKSTDNFDHKVNLSAKSWAWDKDAHTDNVKLGGYGLLNLSTRYHYNNYMSISLNINNALDKDYEMAKGYNNLGRTITLGTIYNF